MPEFIQRPNLQEGLMSLIARMQASRNDPIAEGILRAGSSFGQGINTGLAQRALVAREAEQGRNRILQALAENGELGNMERTGTIRGGQVQWDQPMPEGTRMLSEILPGMGFQAGQTYKKKADKTVSDQLTDAERRLMAKTLKVKPEDLVGVSREVAKSVMPQVFVDPSTGRTVEAPRGAKPLPAVPAPKEPTQAELGARGYADRAQQAEDELGALLKGGYDPTRLWSTRGEYVPNILKNEKDQQAEQSMRNFVSAVLRKESGAAIPPAELATETVKYFPMRGDKPGVVAQKERARAQAIANLAAEGGKAKSTYQQPAPKGVGRFQIKVKGE